MDSYTFLDASVDKLSTTLTFFLSRDAKRMEDEKFQRKVDYSYEKSPSIEPFYKQLKLGREDYFSAVERSYPGFAGVKKSQATVVRK